MLLLVICGPQAMYDFLDKEIEKLTNSLSENNLAKSRAFADLLEADRSILGDDGRLQEICEDLMVNELHVIDEKGIKHDLTDRDVKVTVGFEDIEIIDRGTTTDIVSDHLGQWIEIKEN